jgi:hypothetical protein
MREEVCRVKMAYKLVKKSIYPSLSKVLHLMQDANIHGMLTKVVHSECGNRK